MRNVILLLAFVSSSVLNAQPKLVGTQPYSGTQLGGTVFRMDLPGTTASTLHIFNNLAPHSVLGGVCAGDANWLYGMIRYNGVDNGGALYRIQRDGTGFQVLDVISNSYSLSEIPVYHTDGLVYYSLGTEIRKFNPSNNSITPLPTVNALYSRILTIDADDWIYMVSSIPNATISKMKTDGTQWTDLRTLNGTTDGWSNREGLTEIPGDTLFGVMNAGGPDNVGTIFSIKKDGTGFAVHHQFTTAGENTPESKLVYFDGKLYGTTTQGGSFNNGVLFAINADGTNYHIVHQFDLGSYGTAGIYGNIAISSNGRIFGSYYQFYASGGNYRCFKIDTSGENFSAFINVDQRDAGHFNQDILLLNDETIFLTTKEMGRFDGGALSQFDTSGNGGGLHQFGYSTNGFRPNPLIKATDGKLYGTTVIGGPEGSGTIYSINADGTGYTKLHEFVDAQGYDQRGKLLESSDGRLYGTSQWGGPTNSGTIYRIDKNGANFQVIYSFPNFANGYSPQGSLVEDNTGVLYGTTFYGGSGGSVYRINRDGSGYTVLKTFSGDILYPFNGLTLSGQYLYGSCYQGGIEGKGGIFRIKKDGTGYQVLHDFTGAGAGQNPMATPVIATNNKLYGTTTSGGASSNGIIFSMNLDGTNYATLRDLAYTTDGGSPTGGLIQASDGLMYGATPFGGPSSGGTIYRMNLDGSGFNVLTSFDLSIMGQGVSSIIDLSDVALPVEWLSFDARKNPTTVLLTWKTAQELNSDHFDIERSAGGNNFVPIGNLKAAGNTTQISSYSFTDQQPLPGVNYYRLKQVDFDGKYSYSKTIPVEFDYATNVRITPNPAIDKLSVYLPPSHQYRAIKIFDGNGRLAYQKQINGDPGTIYIEVSQYPKGWYIIELSGDKSLRKMFLKQ